MVDPSALDSYREVMGDEWESFVQSLVDTFIETTPQQLDELKRALDERDWETLKRIAHTLKSSAATLGAEQLVNICVEIEAFVKKDDLEGSGVLIAQLERGLPKVIQDLERIRPEN